MGLLNAPTIRYCESCQKWYMVKNTDELFTCPSCRTIQKKAKCNRCGYTWELHRNRYPANCPKCKSPYFNKQRLQDRKGV